MEQLAVGGNITALTALLGGKIESLSWVTRLAASRGFSPVLPPVPPNCQFSWSTGRQVDMKTRAEHILVETGGDEMTVDMTAEPLTRIGSLRSLVPVRVRTVRPSRRDLGRSDAPVTCVSTLQDTASLSENKPCIYSILCIYQSRMYQSTVFIETQSC